MEVFNTAKSNNLKEYLTGIADKLRALLGASGLINPQDFEQKIQEVYEKGTGSGGPTGITATAKDVRYGKTFGTGGPGKATGTMPERKAQTFRAQAVAQTIPAGAYIAEPLTIAKVDQTGLSAENIKGGAKVEVSSGGVAIYSVDGSPDVVRLALVGEAAGDTEEISFDISNRPGFGNYTEGSFVVEITAYHVERAVGGSSGGADEVFTPTVKYTPETGMGKVATMGKTERIKVYVRCKVWLKE